MQVYLCVGSWCAYSVHTVDIHVEYMCMYMWNLFIMDTIGTT